ncbi:MAG: 5-formyltetrahydrofolate cyclo-ligase [Pseudomonadota bacterium]
MTPEEARRYGQAARRALPAPARRRASQRMCARMAATPWFRDAQCIAVYWAQHDEPQLDALITLAREHGKTVLLPVVRSRGVMQFRAWCSGETLINNRYGIAEPRDAGRRHHQFLSRARHVVCAPLTAFDAQLRRVGMGGGYYDRWFSQRLHRCGVHRIGIAFDCQRVADIEAQSWDVSLHGVVTETRIYKGM